MHKAIIEWALDASGFMMGLAVWVFPLVLVTTAVLVIFRRTRPWGGVILCYFSMLVGTATWFFWRGSHLRELRVVRPDRRTPSPGLRCRAARDHRWVRLPRRRWGWTPLLLSHTRDYGLYLESLLELQWGAVTRPRFGFMRTAEIVYTSGG